MKKVKNNSSKTLKDINELILPIKMINSDQINTLIKTLDISTSNNHILRGFGFYSFKEERFIEIFPPEEFDKYKIEPNGNNLFFTEDLINRIRKFNSYINTKINITGEVLLRKHGMIFGYHTHQDYELQITASKIDSEKVKNIFAPLELVVSNGAKDIWENSPFTANFRSSFRPIKYLDYSILSPENIRTRYNIPLNIATQLHSTKNETNLVPILGKDII